MKRRPPTRIKMMLLLVFLLTSTGRLHANLTTGADHRLHCVNDYLFSVSCNLHIHQPTDSSFYWLTFMETFDLTKYFCPLTNTGRDYFCSFKKPEGSTIFSEGDTYRISLCPNRNSDLKNCKLLDDEYTPVTNIKPNAPCCLTMSHNSSQYSLTWESTYEEYSGSTGLTTNLQYQIHCYRSRDNVSFPNMSSPSTQVIMDGEIFVPDTDYAARVRTTPNQVHYKGQWSDWSPEVHWRAHKDPPSEHKQWGLLSETFLLELCKTVLLPLSVMGVLLGLLFCCAPVKKWRQNVFIPTPAPFFDSLYADCQGDFKSWVVVQENTADMLKTEETLQIDTMTKCAGPRPEGNAYCNVTAPPACDTAPPPALWCPPDGGTDGDSGCWFGSDTSQDATPWYCNEYCTLSAFQHHHSVTAKHHGNGLVN